MGSNKKLGNSFESEFCEYLYEKGFWVLNIPQNAAGQPADVIAVKNQRAYLIDCKVCENDRFPLSRIEPNQHTAMALWKQCGNGYGIFALRLTDGSIYLFGHDLMIGLSIGQSSLNRELIGHYGKTVEDWIRQCR